jgi:hypothetical protein
MQNRVIIDWARVLTFLTSHSELGGWLPRIVLTDLHHTEQRTIHCTSFILLENSLLFTYKGTLHFGFDPKKIQIGFAPKKILFSS